MPARLLVGAIMDTAGQTEAQRWQTALHEAGPCVVLRTLDPTAKLNFILVGSDGNRMSLGHTDFVRSEECDVFSWLIVCAAGACFNSDGRDREQAEAILGQPIGDAIWGQAVARAEAIVTAHLDEVRMLAHQLMRRHRLDSWGISEVLWGHGIKTTIHRAP
jgi:hypothetical protein